MELFLNRALTEWIDENKGSLSRPKFIAQILTERMKQADTTYTGKDENAENVIDGTGVAPSQNKC